MTNTTPGAKVNPEHSHPFDVRAMVLKGAMTLNRDGEARPTGRARSSACRAAACTTRATGRKARWCCSAARSEPCRSMKAPALGWQTRAGVRSVADRALRPDRLAAERPHDHGQRHVQEHPGRALDRRLPRMPGSIRRTISISRCTAPRPSCSTRSASCAAWRGSSSPISMPSGRASRSLRSIAFVQRLTGELRIAAALAALFHLGCGFVLLLAVISEDIMPGYALVLVSMLLAGLWFDRPTARRVIAGRRAVHPGLAGRMAADLPDLAGAAAGAGDRAGAAAPARWPDRRAARHDPRRRPASCSRSGRATTARWACPTCCGPARASTTGWAGLTWDKAWMMLSGVGSYLLTFLWDTAAVDPLRQSRGCRCSLSVALQVAIFVACVVALWPRRDEPRMRAIAACSWARSGRGR